MSALDNLAQILADRIGLVVDAKRTAMLEARIAPLLAECDLRDTQELVDLLRTDRDPELLNKTIDAVVTCETLFFRDRSPFEALRTTILPKLREARRDGRTLRIWSAACATGQEPYSIAMLLDEMMRDFLGWQVEIVASDISQAALATAMSGRYSQFEVQRGLPTPLLLRHFRKAGEAWMINEHLRASIEFRRVNLLQDFARAGTFDVILCRNVLMYMSVDRRRNILERLSRQLAPDGYLMLGATETVVGLTDAFASAPSYPGLFTPAPARAREPLRLVVNS